MQLPCLTLSFIRRTLGIQKKVQANSISHLDSTCGLQTSFRASCGFDVPRDVGRSGPGTSNAAYKQANIGNTIMCLDGWDLAAALDLGLHFVDLVSDPRGAFSTTYSMWAFSTTHSMCGRSARCWGLGLCLVVCPGVSHDKPEALVRKGLWFIRACCYKRCRGATVHSHQDGY